MEGGIDGGRERWVKGGVLGSVRRSQDVRELTSWRPSSIRGTPTAGGRDLVSNSSPSADVNATKSVSSDVIEEKSVLELREMRSSQQQEQTLFETPTHRFPRNSQTESKPFSRRFLLVL